MCCLGILMHVRNIGRTRGIWIMISAETIMHTLVTFQLGRNNSLLAGIPDVLQNRVQRVQNTAARVGTRTPQCSHIPASYQNTDFHHTTLKLRQVDILRYKGRVGFVNYVELGTTYALQSVTMTFCWNVQCIMNLETTV